VIGAGRPYLKNDGSIWICGDYKVTIKQVCQVDSYPLARIDDLFTSLAGGKKKFLKLDLAHAYQQISLVYAARNLVAINTSKGLFQYKNH